MSHIVIIEDNQQNARLASKLLNHAGHAVTVAEDGEGGLNTVMAIRPELVLVDLGLPDVDGQTLVAMMRQQPDLSTMAIIAFTAWPENTAFEMARAYGCDGVITKPLDTRAFASQVAAYLQTKAQPQSPPAAAKAVEAPSPTEAPKPVETPPAADAPANPAPSAAVKPSPEF
jgi:two-component system cell cycle response regulator DivK